MIGLQANRAAQLAAAGGLPVTVAPALGALEGAPPQRAAAPPVTQAPPPEGRHAELLRVAKGINDITLLARIPLLLGAGAFVEDPRERQDMINVLDAVQMASGAPLMGDKARAGAYTLKHSPDTGAALRAVGTDVGTEAALQSIPVLSAILSSLLQQ